MNKIVFLGLAVLLLIGNGIYLYPKYQAINSDPLLEKNPLITQLADNVGNDIQSKVGSLIVPTSFTEPVEKNLASFEALNNSLHSDTLFRVKIWDTNYKVVWSDAPELIGKRFSDNDEVKEVLAEGDRKIEVKRNTKGGADKTELLTESFYNNYFELYYPIKGEDGSVIGIVETYQVINGPLSQIRLEFYKTAALSLGGSIALLILAFFIVRRMNKRSE